MATTRYTGVYEEAGKGGVVKIKIKYMAAGKQQKETLGIKGALIQRGNDELKLDAQVASLIRADRISQVARGGEEVLKRNRPAPTFQDVWDSLRTICKDEPGMVPLTSWWNKYVSRWADNRLDQVNEQDIMAAVKEWETKPEYHTQYKKAPGRTTINHVKKFIMQLYNHAKDRKIYFGRVPLSGAKRNQSKVKILSKKKLDNSKKRAFTPDEAQMILAHLWEVDQMCWLQCKLSLLTGARLREICGADYKNQKPHHGLRWRDVDFINKTITLLRKGGLYQTLPVTDEVIRTLKKFPVGGANQKVTPYFKKWAWDKVRDQINLNPDGTPDLEKASYHTWRHTYATWYMKNGGNIKNLQILMNHSDISTTARYIQPCVDDQLKESEAVAQMLRDQEKAKFQVVK